MTQTTAAPPREVTPRPLFAADILAADHPLYRVFIAWLGGKEPTKRKARAFLDQNPQYRGVQQG